MIEPITAKDVLRQFRRGLRALVGHDFFVRKDINVETLYLGSAYGGWSVVPSLLDASSVIYSAGAGEDITFDTELTARFGCSVEIIDPTPRAKAWFEKTNKSQSLRFHPFGLSDHDGELSFRMPRNSSHVSMSAASAPHLADEKIRFPVRTVSSIATEWKHSEIDLLKLDIEGSEFSVLEKMLDDRIYPTQVLVEFHHRFQSIGIEPSRSMVARLRASGYRLFQVSRSGEEMCFLRA